jgi:hypothetical protein
MNEDESGSFWFLKNDVRSISDYPIRKGKKGFLRIYIYIGIGIPQAEY